MQAALDSPAAPAVALAASGAASASAVPQRSGVGPPSHVRASAGDLLAQMLPAEAHEDEASELLTVLEELGLIIDPGGSGCQLDLPELGRMMFVGYTFFTALYTMAPKGRSGYSIDMRRIFNWFDTDELSDADSVTDSTLQAILVEPLFTKPWTHDQMSEFRFMNMGTILALIAAALHPRFQFDDLRRNPSRLTSGRAAVGFLLKHRERIEVRAVRCCVRGPCMVWDVRAPGGC